jgi:hypothetical protein
MTEKVYGFSSPEQALTGNLNTYIVRTTLNILPTGTATYATGGGPNYSDVRIVDSQYRLDKLVETISSRGQPIILGNVVTTTEVSPADLPVASGTVTVYNLMFTIEHDQSWEVTGTNENLAETLNDLSSVSGFDSQPSVGFVYTSPTTSNNVSVQLVTSATTATILASLLSFPTTKII